MNTPTLPPDLVTSIENSYGVFFEKISKLPRAQVVADLLDESKVHQQIDILCRLTGLAKNDLEGRDLLEIGSGYGVFLSVSRRDYKLQSFGIEPSAVGFEGSFDHAKRVLNHYNIDHSVITDAYGEDIPFSDNTFDFVFSSMVLEHVDNPVKVVDEALRILRPGGVMQITFPNHHSIFDGHYVVFHPPLILGKWFFPWYVKFFHRRDPEFASTIRTELNLKSVRRILQTLRAKHNFELLSLGEEIFLERMSLLNFGSYGGLFKIKYLVAKLRKWGLNRAIAQILLRLGVWSPIILTVRKSVASNSDRK
jgi:SAM-dependent methyltransferase